MQRYNGSPTLPTPIRRLRVAGLFSGIGGFEEGLSQAGHEAVLLCEIDNAAREILRAHYPGVTIMEDVRAITELPRNIDLVTAGFPCQDLSSVGRTRGIKGKNSRLVGDVFRLLGQTPSEWVLLENVPFMLQLHNGRAMRFITGELEKLGYTWAYRTIDSRAFGIPQRRARVFLLASLNHDPKEVLFSDPVAPRLSLYTAGVPCGFYWTEGNRGLGWAINAIPTLKGGSGLGIPSPPAIWLGAGIVTPHLSDGERFQGFEPGWTDPAAEISGKGHRWRLVGNAVTVPVARWIGERLASMGDHQEVPTTPMRKSEKWPESASGSTGKRYRVHATTWPIGRVPQCLDEFLNFDPAPLSEKATVGFLSRLEASTLNCPAEFKDALRFHICGMRRKHVFLKHQTRQPDPCRMAPTKREAQISLR